MRILQVAQKPQRRGAEVFAVQLSEELARRGHEVTLSYLYPTRGGAPLPLRGQDRLLDGTEAHFFERCPGFHPQLLSSLVRLIRSFAPDVVQVNGARTLKYGALARRVDNKNRWVLIYRSIGNVHDWMRGRSRRFFYQTFVMPKVHGIVGVSHATLQGLRDIYALSIPTVRIPRGVDPASLTIVTRRGPLRKSVGTPLNAPVILFVGSLTPEKRLDRFFRVVQRVHQQLPSAHAWVIGDGPLYEELVQQVNSMGLREGVHFLGAQEDVASYMAAADVLLMTSDTEGMPGVALEAGWLGLAVVATRVGGTAECVRHAETGLLMERTDEDGLAQAVIELLEDPKKREQFGEQAREWVRQRFTIDVIAQEYVDFYERVMSGRHSSVSPAAFSLSAT